MQRRVLSSACIATGLALVLVACGIKGSPRPPSRVAAPVVETQPPEPGPRNPVAPSGPTVTPAPDGGTGVPAGDAGTP